MQIKKRNKRKMLISIMGVLFCILLANISIILLKENAVNASVNFVFNKPEGMDVNPPIITINNQTPTQWCNNTNQCAIIYFTVSDERFDELVITGEVKNGTVTIALIDPNKGEYQATILADEEMVVNDFVTIKAKDSQKNETNVRTEKKIKIDNSKPLLSNVVVEKISGTLDKSVIKERDKVKVYFQLDDGVGSGINEDFVKVSLNDSKEVAAECNNDVYSVVFGANSDFKIENKEQVLLSKIICEDYAGNQSIYTDYTQSNITYFAPIVIEELNMVSNNAITKELVARDGDVITATFCTNHSVQLNASKIADRDIIFTSDDGEHWSASYTVENGQTSDMEFISLLLSLVDSAGNEQVNYNENDTITQKIKYYAPITITELIASSDNENGNHLAKEGDTITLHFKTNHEVLLNNALIAGENLSIAEENIQEQIWTLEYQIGYNTISDLSLILFSFLVSDNAGNEFHLEPTNLSQCNHSIQYFAPITTQTSCTSNNPSKDYVKNGDCIKITSMTNHPVNITESEIFDRITNNTGENSTELQMEYQIPDTETKLEQGEVPFRFILTDQAGNLKKVTSSVNKALIYDRTNPTTEIAPNTFIFTSKSIRFHIGFHDEHLSAENLSVMLNDKEMISEQEKATFLSETDYSKEVYLYHEGDYTIKSFAIDKAGNSSNQNAITSITIDKCKPEIYGLGLTISKPTVQKPGFVISKSFLFADNNIKDVICTLTNKNGTCDWNIDTPITIEGKNSITIIVVDMAGNTSNTITYDFYIDHTIPKPIVKELSSQTNLQPTQESKLFYSTANLMICLESLHISGVANPDQFTRLQIIDSDKNKVIDLLKEVNPQNGIYQMIMHKVGAYTLVAEAQDEVGNETGILQYHFEIIEKDKNYYIILPVSIGLLMVVGICVIIKKRKHKCKQ